MRTWIFHRGALGDSVLLWPRIRMELREGRAVTLVSDGEKARLAARELGIVGLDAESPRFNALWREGAAVEKVSGVTSVVCAGGGGDPAGAWGRNVRRMFPGAELEVIERPNRALYGGGDPGAGVPLRQNPAGPLVVHIGAGGAAKRWPMGRWAGAVCAWRESDVPARWSAVEVTAGEVERERLNPEERAIFHELGGRVLDSLEALAAALKGARLFVGCDSGPTHLAAAVGVRTVALFGPTDPELWAPIGPCVRVIAPPLPGGMEWLEVARVVGAVRDAS